jgi:hypothetical protein
MTITYALFLYLTAYGATNPLEYTTLFSCGGDAATDVIAAMLDGNCGEDLAGTDRDWLPQFDCRGRGLMGNLLPLVLRCSLTTTAGDSCCRKRLAQLRGLREGCYRIIIINYPTRKIRWRILRCSVRKLRVVSYMI